jgi:hypothetical protein
MPSASPDNAKGTRESLNRQYEYANFHYFSFSENADPLNPIFVERCKKLRVTLDELLGDDGVLLYPRNER